MDPLQQRGVEHVGRFALLAPLEGRDRFQAGAPADEAIMEFMAGLGIALISAHTVSAELSDERLVVFDVKGLPIVRKWFVVTQKDRRLLPAAEALWDFFATSGAAFLPDLER